MALWRFLKFPWPPSLNDSAKQYGLMTCYGCWTGAFADLPAQNATLCCCRLKQPSEKERRSFSSLSLLPWRARIIPCVGECRQKNHFTERSSLLFKTFRAFLLDESYLMELQLMGSSRSKKALKPDAIPKIFLHKPAKPGRLSSVKRAEKRQHLEVSIQSSFGKPLIVFHWFRVTLEAHVCQLVDVKLPVVELKQLFNTYFNFSRL